MRNYGKLVATLVQNHLPTMRNYGKLVDNRGANSCVTKENHLPTMRNYAKSSTYYEKLW